MLKPVGLAVAVALVAGPALAQDWRAQPNYGSAHLDTGFLPDPHTVEVVAGGAVNVADTIGGDCVGFISGSPDYDLYYQAGSQYSLIISANSSTDLTLVIHAPDGTWHCDDDGGNYGFNPALVFLEPQSGLYDIWVGTRGEQNSPAVLAVSEAHSF